MLKKLRKNKKGFTLVELIVVIVIILVLSAVMVPNVLKYIDKANQANCKADAATLLVQVQAEVAEAYSEGKALGDVTIGGVTVKYQADATTNPATYSAATAGSATGLYNVDAKGSVSAFAYQDGSHYINWAVVTGWSEVG